ncbi:MAG TPA: hypothetical protein VM532_17100, partial [Burkholderiales bacterium]|nr:hypothetical protein [Burkholderiales bacterium]
GFVAEGWVISTATYLAFPLALLFCMPIVRDRHPSNKIPTLGIIKRILIYSLLLGFSYAFAWTGLALGGAALMTDVFGDERIAAFTIIDKSDGGGNKRECTYSLMVQEQGSEWRAKVCIDQDFWRVANQGEAVSAKLRYSAFGAIVEELSRPMRANPLTP